MTLRILESTLTLPPPPAKLRVEESTLSLTPGVAQKLRILEMGLSLAPQVRVHTIYDVPSVLPGTVLSQSAVLSSGGPGAVTWTWTQVSGPDVTPTLVPNGASVSFVAPSVMPGAVTTIVLGVTATIGGVTSPQVTATFDVLPQTFWAWNGTKWVGSSLRGLA
jgi:hypothetical protein